MLQAPKTDGVSYLKNMEPATRRNMLNSLTWGFQPYLVVATHCCGQVIDPIIHYNSLKCCQPLDRWKSESPDIKIDINWPTLPLESKLILPIAWLVGWMTKHTRNNMERHWRYWLYISWRETCALCAKLLRSVRIHDKFNGIEFQIRPP